MNNLPIKDSHTIWDKILAGLILSLAGQICLAEDSLISDSPFLPATAPQAKLIEAEAKPTGPSKINKELEFRSVVRFGETWEFSLHHLSDKKSHWLGLKDAAAGAPFTILDFDMDQARILVEWEGDRDYLDLILPSGKRLNNNPGLAYGLTPNLAPAQPPSLVPPATPPPPPVGGPPAGPPPEIPPEVMKRFEMIVAAQQANPDSVNFDGSGGLPGAFGGIAGGAPPDPGTSLGIKVPTVTPGAAPGTGGGTAGGGSGDVDIPTIPGFDPGSGPPTGPPNIVIPDIPEIPGDGG